MFISTNRFEKLRNDLCTFRRFRISFLLHFQVQCCGVFLSQRDLTGHVRIIMKIMYSNLCIFTQLLLNQHFIKSG
jgi:hypothetical protein